MPELLHHEDARERMLIVARDYASMAEMASQIESDPTLQPFGGPP